MQIETTGSAQPPGVMPGPVRTRRRLPGRRLSSRGTEVRRRRRRANLLMATSLLGTVGLVVALAALLR
jgi:hypothetical protein